MTMVTATTATGMLSARMNRQPRVSVNRPPISGPAALPNPTTPRIRPPASPRRASGSTA